jgi:hypothetical protein
MGRQIEIRGSHEGYVTLNPFWLDGDRWQRGVSAVDCSCEMAAHRFTGSTYPDDPCLSIRLDELQRFVNEMRTLEHDRGGKATLESSQLRLIFKMYDRPGHVRLTAALRDPQPEGDHYVEVPSRFIPLIYRRSSATSRICWRS